MLDTNRQIEKMKLFCFSRKCNSCLLELLISCVTAWLLLQLLAEKGSLLSGTRRHANEPPGPAVVLLLQLVVAPDNNSRESLT